MRTLAVILARAGSKGLPDKCLRLVSGRPLIEFSFDHALAATHLAGVVLTTDSEPAKTLARRRGIEVVDRPAALATDTATIDAAVRHAVESWELRHRHKVDAVAILYGNIPVRAAGIIDRCIAQLEKTGGSSVRTVAPIGKHHPDWLHRLSDDRMTQFRENDSHRRQDLEPLYYHDGAVIVVTRAALFNPATAESAQAFLGDDRRAVIQSTADAVDVDEPIDLAVAEAILGDPSTPQISTNTRAHAPETSRASEPAGTRIPTPSTQHENRALDPVFSPKSKIQNPKSDAASAPAGHPSKRDFPLPGAFPRPVGSTLIIAEIGVNHDGSVEKARELITAAIDAGADAVKFQVFRAAELASAGAPTAAYQRAAGERSQREMLQQLELTDDEFQSLRAFCVERGIVFLATPFGLMDVDRVVAMRSAAIKIASTDLTNAPLLRKAAHSGLPLIVSVGAATRDEILGTAARLRAWGVAERLVLLHCISRYPAPLSTLNLRAIAALRAAANLPIGFSDHSTDTAIGAWAVAAGACVLEKHLTLDRRLRGPDHAMSLDPDQFALYVACVRQVDLALGSGEIGMTEDQADVRDVARKSVVATCDLRAGTVVTPDMLTIKRPAGGIEPDSMDAVVGRTLAVDVLGDTPLTWQQFA
jgi:N,N'-diacetyllegionaminate synthase